MSQTETKPEDAPEEKKPVVFELRNVTFRSKLENSVRLVDTSLVVREGELIVVYLDPFAESRQLASMMQGLQQPKDGEVRFKNQTWLGEDYDAHFNMRSRIGRVFDGQAWIENLNVDENVTLASCHHGVTDESVDRDIQHLAERFGLDGLSRKRPAFLEPSLLQVHQWIRAFLGKPALVILERPMRSVSQSMLPKLVKAVDDFRRRGASVMWFTSDRGLAPDRFSPPVFPFEVRNERLVHTSGDSKHE